MAGIALATRGHARKPVAYAIVDLPRALSTNNLWMVARGRMILTPEYRAWKEECGHALNRSNPGCVSGPYGLTIYLNSKSRCDLGNIEKACSDLLQEHGVIDNDRKAQIIRLERSSNVPGIQVQVTQCKESA